MHLKMVKMLSVTQCIFYHIKNLTSRTLIKNSKDYLTTPKEARKMASLYEKSYGGKAGD